MRYFVVIVLLIVSGCTRSLIYSPSLNIAPNPLGKNESDFQGGIGLFPETRPHMLENDKKTSLGAFGQYSFGFTKTFAFSSKVWIGLEMPEESRRYGFALSSQINKSISDQSRLIFIPTLGIAIGGIGSGKGGGLAIIYQKETGKGFGYYTGTGFISGYEDTYETQNGTRLSMGTGIIGYFGFSSLSSDNFYFNLELNPIYQINYFENKKHFVLSPTATLGIRLNK